MSSPVLLCTDGSDQATKAVAAGLALLAPGSTVVIVTVLDEPDPTLLTGTGFAGGVVSPEEFDQQMTAADQDALRIVAETRTALGLPDVEGKVLEGAPGPAICAYATEVGAAAIVTGSAGRGGIKRAVLGSVSDHVVRHAGCPVIVAGQHAVE